MRLTFLPLVAIALLPPMLAARSVAAAEVECPVTCLPTPRPDVSPAALKLTCTAPRANGPEQAQIQVHVHVQLDFGQGRIVSRDVPATAEGCRALPEVVRLLKGAVPLGRAPPTGPTPTGPTPTRSKSDQRASAVAAPASGSDDSAARAGAVNSVQHVKAAAPEPTSISPPSSQAEERADRTTLPSPSEASGEAWMTSKDAPKGESRDEQKDASTEAPKSAPPPLPAEARSPPPPVSESTESTKPHHLFNLDLGGGLHLSPLMGIARASHRARLRAQLHERVARGSPTNNARLGWALAFVFSIIIGVGVTRALTPECQFEFSEGSVHHAIANGVVLREGSVEVKTSEQTIVLTPEFQVIVRSGRLSVTVAEARTVVEVFAGLAEVHREKTVVSLGPGQVLASDDARFERPRLAGGAPLERSSSSASGSREPSSCEEGHCPPRHQNASGQCDVRACLEQQAESGDDIGAQTALMRLGLDALSRRAYEAAATIAHRSLTRFPEGVLVPEIHLVLLESLHRQGKSAEARAEASWYVEHQPQAPQAAQVALLWGDLELRAGNPTRANEVYAKALESAPDTDVVVEALYGQGIAWLRLGDSQKSREALARALEVKPNGPRAAELRWRLMP